MLMLCCAVKRGHACIPPESSKQLGQLHEVNPQLLSMCATGLTLRMYGDAHPKICRLSINCLNKAVQRLPLLGL